MDNNNPAAVPEENLQKSFSIDTLAVGGITVIAYLIVFIYERAYIEYFGFTDILVSVSLEKFFIVLVSLAGVLTLFYFLFDIFFSFLFQSANDLIYRKLLSFIFVMIFTLIPYMYVGKVPFDSWVKFLIMWGSVLLFHFSFPMFVHRNKKTYVEKLEASDEVDEKFPLLFEKFGVSIGGKYGPAFIFFLFYILVVVVPMIGRGEAEKQEEFYIIKENEKTLVLLRNYGDELIFVPLTEINGSKILKREFYIKSISNLSNQSLEMERLGPLKSEDL